MENRVITNSADLKGQDPKPIVGKTKKKPEQSLRRQQVTSRTRANVGLKLGETSAALDPPLGASIQEMLLPLVKRR